MYEAVQGTQQNEKQSLIVEAVSTGKQESSFDSGYSTSPAELTFGKLRTLIEKQILRISVQKESSEING